MTAKSLDVALFKNESAHYPSSPPFNPSKRYPEYPFQTDNSRSRDNDVYEAVRETLSLLKFDPDNFGSKKWNPFRNLIHPGNSVVVKPNFVSDRHWNNGDLFSVITHPSVIRAVVDYCYIALKGVGEIIIADSPVPECDFNSLLNATRLQSISSLYKKQLSFDVKILDLRPYYWGNSLESNRQELPGDPLGYATVNLKENSTLSHLNSRKFWSTNNNREETAKYHNNKTHKYLISQTILSADCVILLPKLKVHRKVGVTLNAKSLVGTVGNKQCLPHFRMGTPVEGGDSIPDNPNTKVRAFLKVKSIISDILSKNTATEKMKTSLMHRLHKNNLLSTISINSFMKDTLHSHANTENRTLQFNGGSWQGNDTAWRMVADLYHIFFFADKKGNMNLEPKRNVFSIVDGITGGDGDGPLSPTSKRCGIILGGLNPIAVDLVAARLMGIDYNRLKLYQEILNSSKWTILSMSEISQIKIESNDPKYADILKDDRQGYLRFEPPLGWKNIKYAS